MNDLKSLQSLAIRTHVYRINLRHLATEEQPFGPVSQLQTWCLDNIGPRWHGWFYLGCGLWAFDKQENAAMFNFVWG